MRPSNYIGRPNRLLGFSRRHTRPAMWRSRQSSACLVATRCLRKAARILYPNGLNMLAEITEAEAVGEVATIYRRIKEVQGSPVVNLIWRHLATIEGALAWAWPLAEDARPK